MSKTTNRNKLGWTQVRMVVSQDQVHLCGMCRSTYEQIERAANCLRQCLVRFLDGSLLGQNRATKSYQCLICTRLYADKKGALSCIQECKQEAINHLEQLIATIQEQEAANPAGTNKSPRQHQAATAGNFKRPDEESSEMAVEGLRLAEQAVEQTDEFDELDDAITLSVGGGRR